MPCGHDVEVAVGMRSSALECRQAVWSYVPQAVHAVMLCAGEADYQGGHPGLGNEAGTQRARGQGHPTATGQQHQHHAYTGASQVGFGKVLLKVYVIGSYGTR